MTRIYISPKFFALLLVAVAVFFDSCIASCVRSERGLRNAIAASVTPIIKICKDIKLSNSTTSVFDPPVTFTGIDVTGKNLQLVCTKANRRKCTIDGQGHTRLFYGLNARFEATNFNFINAYATESGSYQGGALAFYYDSIIKLNQCAFQNNTIVSFGGGALFAETSTVVLNGTTTKPTKFSRNNGTALSLYLSELIADSPGTIVFTKKVNLNDTYIYMDESNATLIGALFDGSATPGNGDIFLGGGSDLILKK